ncbi:MAG: hypothetical protein GY851_32620 [bacterium]|nr:hypothetical protein [bacterium]
MRTRIPLTLAVLAAFVLVPTAANAWSITVQYEGQTIDTINEGETMIVPPYSSLTPVQQGILDFLGLTAEFVQLEGTSIYLPVGCLTEDITINVSLADVPEAIIAVSLDVVGHTGDYNFNTPYPIVTLPYGSVAHIIADEGELTLAFYVGGEFVTTGITGLTIDDVNNLVSGQVAHLSTVAIQGPKALPVAGYVAISLTLVLVGAAGVFMVLRRRSA